MTRSTFSGFTTAHLAMAASQRAIDVTGQNIANINTKGYTRQRVDLVSFNTRGGDSMSTAPSSKIGYGVEITGISQIRDPFLDVQFRNQIAKVGTADAKQAVLDQLADIFDETDKAALKQALSDLSSSLDKLSSNANSREFDSIVRSRFQVITDYIHQKSADLKTVREETINGLENTDIPVVNNLLSDIGKLNDAIWKSQVQGNPSLELLDERNNKLDELAGYLPISVTYKDVHVSKNVKFEYPEVKFRAENGMTYNLTGGEHGENYASISLERNKEPEGTISIFLTPASDFPMGSDVSALKSEDLSAYLREGSLKGTVDALNKSGELDSPSTDFRGLGYYEKSFETFVQVFAKTFNDLNAGKYTGGMRPYTGAMLSSSNTVSKSSAPEQKLTFAMDLSKSTGNFLSGETITINNKTVIFGDGTGGTVKIEATLEASMKNLANSLNDPPSASDLYIDGDSVSSPGTWSYKDGKLLWVSNNSIMTDGKKVAVDDTGTAVSLQYNPAPDNKRDFNLFRTSDGSTTFTASNIKISDDWMNNTIYIISSDNENAGTTANDNILKMLKALTDERSFEYKPETGYNIPFYKGSFFQCYSNLENAQGIDSASNSTVLTHHMSVLAQTADNKDSVSGVSLDEEGISLMQYQRSFSAAARLMTTLDEALNILINSTGLVGR